MGKVKDRKSDSWKPGMVPNSGGMISKNKKRKEKRLSQNMNMVKAHPAGTPSKKAAFSPLNKMKENLNSSLNIPSLGKKKENKLSVSLPIRGDKKGAKMNLSPQKKDVKPTMNLSPQKKDVKLTGILSHSNTPNKKSKKITFKMEPDDDDKKFIDSEAEEGEEPITDKVVKPYEKGSQKRKLKNEMSMMNGEDSSDEDSDSDDEAFDSADNFLDMEASEGEETDESDDDDDESVEDESGDEDDDDDDEIDDFLNDDGDDVDDSEDGSDDAEGESDDESEEESDTKPPVLLSRRESVALSLPNKAKKDLASTPQSNKTKVKVEPIEPKVSEQPSVIGKKKLAATPQPDKVKLKSESVEAKVSQKQAAAQMKNSTNDNALKGHAENKRISDFVGFIRRISKVVTDDAVKSALVTKIEPKNIVSIVGKSADSDLKRRDVLVYLKNEESLDALLNTVFKVNENSSFKVYRARESTRKKENLVAFLPRVPLHISAEALKEALDKEIGANAVLNVKFKRLYKHFNAHNALVEFADLESLQKIVQKGECKIGDSLIIVRTAFEAAVKIPAYKILFSSIPPKTPETVLKKCIEAQVGKDTVLSVRFTFKNPSSAYVSLRSEEALKKALEVGKNVSVNGTKLGVEEFRATPPKKRAARSQEAKQKKKEEKKRKREGGAGAVADSADGSSKPPKKKFKKNKTNGPAASPAPEAKKQTQSPSKAAVDASVHSKNKKKGAQNPSSPSPAAPAKKNKQKFSKPGKFANVAQESQSSAKVDVGSSHVSPKQQKKKNKQANQKSPEFVAKKKQLLAAKMVNKAKKFRKGSKKE